MTEYFSLLYNDQLKVAPGKKVIPAEEFSKLVSAQEVLTQIEEEAKRYREQMAQEGEELKEARKEEGFQEGMNAWADQIAKLEAKIDSVHDELKKLLVPVALQAAKKVVGREISLDKNTVADIVLSNLRSVSGHKRVTIYCNQNDLDVLEENKDRLKALFERLETLSIQPRDDIDEGGCVIETEAGIINAQWENQWQALERALEAVLKS